MSGLLSHIDFDSEVLQDNDEEELEKEDAKQEMEIKEFLANELDDEDLLNDTYESNVTQIQNNSRLSTSNYQSNYTNVPYNTDQYSLHGQHASNNIYIDQHNEHTDTNLIGNYTTQTYSPYQYSNTEQQSNQIEILYQARGRKIEELQNQLEEVNEGFAKEKRIMQHKLNMLSAEKTGMQASNDQLHNLLEQYKLDIKNIEDKNSENVMENDKLRKEIFELEEKLSISDSTVDALQQQVTELSKSDSLSRARVQHESLLASVREKHNNEILSLNEKLDELKQALAWKTEDVNRYKEMLDSSSSSSEIGILRSRLAGEERKTSELTKAMEEIQNDNRDLEQQLTTYQSLLTDKSSHLSSTPILNAATAFLNQRKQLDFQTPISKNLISDAKTPKSTDSNLRQELLKTLSLNHEKRKEIQTLKEEIFILKNQTTKSDNKQYQESTHVDNKKEACESCKALQKDLEKMNSEFLDMKNKNDVLIEENTKLNNDMNQVKSNMSDMIRNFDEEKRRLNESQNDAIMKLIDDAKLRITNELTDAYENEKNSLYQQIENLTSESLTTKQEYLKLCDELKIIEKRIKDEASTSKEFEIEELKLNMQSKFLEDQKKLENDLALKHFNELDIERNKIRDIVTIEMKDLHDRQVESLKDELQLEFEEQKEKEINEAIMKAKVGWKCNCQNRTFDALQKESVDLKRQIEVMENKLISSEKVIDELKKREWLENNKELFKKPTDCSQTSMIFNEILDHTEKETCSNCQYFINKFKQMEKDSKTREDQLMILITKTTEQLNKSYDQSFTEENESSSKDELNDTSLNFDTLLKSKLRSWKIKEKSYNVEINKLNESIEKLKERLDEKEKVLNIKCEEYIKLNKQNKELQSTIDDLQANIKEREKSFEKEKREIENRFERTIKEISQQAKEKQQAETSKLKEEVLKAENELIRTHLLSDLHSTVNVSQEVKLVEQKYETHIQDLKKGFREKLTKINEMKKKWLQEEDEKREHLKQRLLSDHTNKVLHLQTEHEAYTRKLSVSYENKIQQLKHENEATVANLKNEIESLQEEFNEKNNLLLDLEKKFKKGKMELQTEHEKEIELLCAEHMAKIQTYEQRMSEEFKTQLNEELCKTKQQYDIDLKESYQRGYTNGKESCDSSEKIRQLYLKTLQEINNDVMKHVQVTKQQAVDQMKSILSKSQHRIGNQTINNTLPINISHDPPIKQGRSKNVPRSTKNIAINKSNKTKQGNTSSPDIQFDSDNPDSPKKLDKPGHITSLDKPGHITSPYYKISAERRKNKFENKYIANDVSNNDVTTSTYDSSLMTSLRELPQTPRTPKYNENGVT